MPTKQRTRTTTRRGVLYQILKHPNHVLELDSDTPHDKLAQAIWNHLNGMVRVKMQILALEQDLLDALEGIGEVRQVVDSRSAPIDAERDATTPFVMPQDFEDLVPMTALTPMLANPESFHASTPNP